MLLNSLLLFLDVSGGELLVIILVVFLVFGPQKMPEIARKIGKAMNEMKKASNDLTREFRQEASGIREEIRSAHSGVKEEIDQVAREVDQTRAGISRDMKVDNSPVQGSAAASDEAGAVPEKPQQGGEAG